MNINQLFNKVIITVIALITVTLAAPVDSELRAAGRRCVSYVFDYNFTAAHSEADAVIRNYPNSPAGYFFKAAVYHYQMNDLGEKRFATQFYSACERGVELGEDAATGPAGEWDRFFMAGTLGIQGAYERSRNRLVTALKLGWRSIEVFRPLRNSGNIDALYGVAVYDFWVGANIRVLWWMEDATDERPRALRDLQRVTTEGVFTTKVVLYDLLEMYKHEEDYVNLENISLSILNDHPNNTVASEYLFHAQVELQKYQEARTTLLNRTAKLRERNAPSARYNQLSEDWQVLERKSGLSR